MHVTQQEDTKKTLFALAKQVQVSQKVEKKINENSRCLNVFIVSNYDHFLWTDAEK